MAQSLQGDALPAWQRIRAKSCCRDPWPKNLSFPGVFWWMARSTSFPAQSIYRLRNVPLQWDLAGFACVL
ncbi:Hypothetical protein P9303_04081 [Prochlorococcus marinus str. MIT 9303]|uniref:Uncharacterized protein n=1 Tax=Prochlorococcus marinus (strain MIT 9303) TaxID=59922 RepID=A2C6Q0_PROM3|nr:Hypothetical protein P9303_04081 [Prochlorococcus marinus str. MIT 9303]